MDMPDNPLDNIKDEFYDEDDGVFECTCDQCGHRFPSNTVVWDDFEQLSEEHDRLQLIYNTSGFHEVWHCTKKCQTERIAELRESILKDFGPTCGSCSAKIGTERMKPCHTCKKLACNTCGIKAGRMVGWWCSEDCKPKFKRCSGCNRELWSDNAAKDLGLDRRGYEDDNPCVECAKGNSV